MYNSTGDGNQYDLAKKVKWTQQRYKRALQKRGETAKQNWCSKLQRLKTLGVIFPSTVPNHRQVETIAQVRMCCGHVLQCKCVLLIINVYCSHKAWYGHLKKRP